MVGRCMREGREEQRPVPCGAGARTFLVIACECGAQGGLRGLLCTSFLGIQVSSSVNCVYSQWIPSCHQGGLRPSETPGVRPATLSGGGVDIRRRAVHRRSRKKSSVGDSWGWYSHSGPSKRVRAARFRPWRRGRVPYSSRFLLRGPLNSLVD